MKLTTKENVGSILQQCSCNNVDDVSVVPTRNTDRLLEVGMKPAPKDVPWLSLCSYHAADAE